MKNIFLSKFFLVISLLFSASILFAQKGDPNLDSQNSHYFTISLSGGASGYTMMPSYRGILVENPNFEDHARPVVLHPDSLHLIPFLGGSFGFGYEYHTARGFWLSIGLEGQILSGGLHHADSIYRIEKVMDGNIETGVKEATIEYTVIKWKERQANVYATLPILLGYKHESGFYFGAGAKLGFSLYNRIDGNFGFANCNLMYEGILDMDGFKRNLDLNDVKSVDSNFVYLPQVNPMLEIGWQGLDLDISKDIRMRFKFALVGELGLLSAYNNQNSAEQLFDYEDLEGFRPEDLENFFKSVNSFYSTIPLGISKPTFNALNSEGKFVNFNKPSTLSSWFIGFKFGIMFEMPHRKPCNCLRNNVTKPWTKSRKDKGVE